MKALIAILILPAFAYATLPCAALFKLSKGRFFYRHGLDRKAKIYAHHDLYADAEIHNLTLREVKLELARIAPLFKESHVRAEEGQDYWIRADFLYQYRFLLWQQQDRLNERED